MPQKTTEQNGISDVAIYDSKGNYLSPAHAQIIPDHYTMIPKKEPLTFPDPVTNPEQYDHPIGPEKPASKPAISGKGILSTIKKVANNPMVRKAGRILKERTDVFQENIGDVATTAKTAKRDPDPFNVSGIFGRRNGETKKDADPFGVAGIFGVNGTNPGDNPFKIKGK